MDDRKARALHIAATSQLTAVDGRWKVPSQNGPGHYIVTVGPAGAWECTCEDYEERLDRCKHIMAVELTIQREVGVARAEYSELVKVTYSQDWPAYNRAQTGEKRMFLHLLEQLCELIPQPLQKQGRPRLPLADMVFAAVYKTYAGFSARRFDSDLRTAQADGLVSQAAAFNSVLRYLRAPELEQLLLGLIEVSSLPMAAIETSFAIDSTGFSTSNKRSWFSTKQGRVLTHRDYRKLHATVGTATHVVTAVAVSPAASNDAPFLAALAGATAANFEIGDFVADKGYLTKENAEVIERLGGTPYIPFKSNTVRPAVGTAWARMHHLYAFQREAFMAHYHQRSNVETVFMMIKMKFGELLRGKTESAQTNEILTKVLAHNLCVLIQSFHELGLDPTFDATSRPASNLLQKISF